MSAEPAAEGRASQRDVSPEIPPEVQRRMTPRAVWRDPLDKEGPPGDAHVEQALVTPVEADRKHILDVLRRITAACRAQKIAVDAIGLPIARPVKAKEAARIMAKKYPGAPEMDPGLGDRTPVFVEWIYPKHPADAAIRYFGRRTHLHDADKFR